MRRRITGFHRDTEGHWVAELECGHGQHVRHDPPWQVRPWVLDEATRRDHLGTWLDCRRCDEAPPPSLPAETGDRYIDARLSGLCEDGAREAAAPRPARGGTT